MQKGVDFVGVGVGAAILNEEGKLFLARRGENAKNERGKWETPGGSLEYGEKLEETLIREIQEEYGCKIEIVDQLGVFDHIIPEEKQHWVAISFLCTIVSGEPTILEPHKCSEIGWFSLEEAQGLELTLTAQHDISALKKRFPGGLHSISS